MRICSLKSADFSTKRIPFPPPPAEAFIKIGYPTSSAILMASSISVIAESTPGTKGTLYDLTACLALNLSPINSIDSGEGPINFIPASRTLRAKPAFSDRKPYPG